MKIHMTRAEAETAARRNRLLACELPVFKTEYF